MKKLIAAAVATSVSAIAIADVSIGGNANYEYFSTTVGSDTTYTADTEVNLNVRGKTGDTSVALDLEFNNHGTVDGSGTSHADNGTGNLDIENMYLTTKVGDINIKAGHYSSGTTALAGEIEAGGRATDKVTLSTNVGGWTVGYAVSESTSMQGDGASVSLSGNVNGVKVQLKEQSDSATYVGVQGSLAGIDYRLENKDADAASSDVFFGDISTKVGDMTVGYTILDADSAGKIEEGDSTILGLSVNGTDSSTISGRGTTATGASQFRISAPMAGNTISAKIGTIDDGIAAGTDVDFTELKLTRKLASGATLNLIFDDYDSASGVTTEVIELDLSVNF
jgi:hypothetical protein